MNCRIIPDVINPKEIINSGLISLLMMANLHGIAADEAKLTHEFGSEPYYAWHSFGTILTGRDFYELFKRYPSTPVPRLLGKKHISQTGRYQ